MSLLVSKDQAGKIGEVAGYLVSAGLSLYFTSAGFGLIDFILFVPIAAFLFGELVSLIAGVLYARS